jgi:hypothetical protein
MHERLSLLRPWATPCLYKAFSRATGQPASTNRPALRVEEPFAAVCRGLAWSMIGGTRSRRLSSAVETPDGLTPSAQPPIAIPLDTGSRQRIVLRGPRCRARNLFAIASVESRSASQKVGTLRQAQGRQVPSLRTRLIYWDGRPAFPSACSRRPDWPL